MLGGSLPNEILKAYKQQKLDTQQTDGETGAVIHESNISVAGLLSQPTLQLSGELKAVQHSTNALASTTELPVIESLSTLQHLTAQTVTSLPEMLSPVKQAIARYLGIDLSPEAEAAERRKGVSVIVHGTPSSGRTTQAQRIAEAYGATVLVMDKVIIEAISSARTEASRQARKLCMNPINKEELSEAPSNIVAAIPKKQVNAVKEKEKEKETVPEIPTIPTTPSHFPVNVLQDTEFAVPEGKLFPTILPEKLIHTILTERLQQMDCYRGVVFDGVESHFTANIQMSSCIILRALGHRTHIYFVNLEMCCKEIQKRLDDIEESKRLQEEKIKEDLLLNEKTEKERIKQLLALDEDEYEAKSIEEQREIDLIRHKVKKDKREKRKLEKEEREQRERELREEETKRLEEEKSRKKGRKDAGKQSRPSHIAKPLAVSTLLNQAGGTPTQSRPPSSQAHTLPLGQVPVTASTADVQSRAESPAGTPKKKVPKKGSARASAIIDSDQLVDDMPPLQKKYSYYLSTIDSIKCVLEDWDRQKGAIRPKKLLSEIEENPSSKHTPSKKAKGGKVKEEPIVEAHPETPESREGVGVPLLKIQGYQEIEAITDQLFAQGLPSVESILEGLGLCTDEVPLPGPVEFQVYPFPLKRRNIDHASHERFSFIAASPNDLYVIVVFLIPLLIYTGIYTVLLIAIIIISFYTCFADYPFPLNQECPSRRAPQATSRAGGGDIATGDNREGTCNIQDVQTCWFCSLYREW